MKQPIQICLFWALSLTSVFALCKNDSCSDSIETLDATTLENITEELNDTLYVDTCKQGNHTQEASLLFYCLHEARCSAEYIHEVYTHYADLITAEQAKYLFSRSPQASCLLNKLVFGLEYAKKALEESGDDSLAFEQILIALDKAKATHCPHCYVKIIIPAIDKALLHLDYYLPNDEGSGCNHSLDLAR